MSLLHGFNYWMIYSLQWMDECAFNSSMFSVAVKRVHNWKSPESDCIHGFWLKYLCSLHPVMLRVLIPLCLLVVLHRQLASLVVELHLSSKIFQKKIPLLISILYSIYMFVLSLETVFQYHISYIAGH